MTAALASEFVARRSATRRPDFRDRLAPLGDDDALASLHTLDELCEMGLGLVEADFHSNPTGLKSDQCAAS